MTTNLGTCLCRWERDLNRGSGQRCVSESEFCAPTGGRAGGWARRRARVSSAAPTHHNDAGADQEQLHHVYQQLDLILFVVVVRGLHYSELIITLSLLACSRSFRDHDSVYRRKPLDRRWRSCLVRVGCVRSCATIALMSMTRATPKPNLNEKANLTRI